MSDRPRAALLVLLGLTVACPGPAAESGARLLITFKRHEGTPAPQYLLLTWVGGGTVYVQDQHLPASGLLPDAPVLGTFEIAVREPGPRTIVARGFAGEQQVAEGAIIVPDTDRTKDVDLELFPGQFVDTDGDGIPDPVDNCRTEPNQGQGPCLAGDGGQEEGDAGASPDLEPPADGAAATPDVPPDTMATPPDLIPSKLPRGRACLDDVDCDTGHCGDSRVGHFCSSAGMVAVPAGPFMRGCLAKDSQCQADEQPLRTIMLSGFEIDATEVIQSQYNACVKAGVCAAPSGFNPTSRPSNPVGNATWAMANGYCQWASKRLPTEAEWEKTARGPGSTIYPWGDQPPDCSHAQYKGCGLADSVPVAQLAGTSGYGAEDLAGNVAEWVSDFYAAGYYAGSPATDPPGAASGMHVRRGGGFSSDPPALRTSARAAGDATAPSAGFRCAKSL